jgi:hypothetical protein
MLRETVESWTLDLLSNDGNRRMQARVGCLRQMEVQMTPDFVSQRVFEYKDIVLLLLCIKTAYIQNKVRFFSLRHFKRSPAGSHTGQKDGKSR